MTTTTRETTVTVDPDLPLLRITREFDAPREKVFRAHTDPALVAQWLGPRGYEMRVGHYDCVTGGSYRYVHVDGDAEHEFYGSFHEVRPDVVIVQTFSYVGEPGGVTLERMVFEDLGEGRTRITGTSLAESFESRDAWAASGMEDGVRQSYERLDDLLAG